MSRYILFTSQLLQKINELLISSFHFSIFSFILQGYLPLARKENRLTCMVFMRSYETRKKTRCLTGTSGSSA